MQIDLNKLNSSKEITINDEVYYEEANYQNIGIKRLENVVFNGKVTCNNLGDIKVFGDLSADMYLLDAISAEEILVPIAIKIEEIYPLEDETFINKDKNTLEIKDILWQNIVLEVPIRVTHTSLNSLKGDEWSLVSDDEERIDPRLAPLQELLDKGKE